MRKELHLYRNSDMFTNPEHCLRGNGLLYVLQNCLRITIRQNRMPSSDFPCDISYVDTNLGKTCVRFLDSALALLTVS